MGACDRSGTVRLRLSSRPSLDLAIDTTVPSLRRRPLRSGQRLRLRLASSLDGQQENFRVCFCCRLVAPQIALAGPLALVSLRFQRAPLRRRSSDPDTDSNATDSDTHAMSRPGARPMMKSAPRRTAGGDMQDVDIDMSPPHDSPASPSQPRVPRAPAAAAAATGSAGRKATATTLRPSPSKTQPLPSGGAGSKLLPAIGAASSSDDAGALLSLPPPRLPTGSLRPTDPAFSGGHRTSQTFFTLSPSSLDFTGVAPGLIYFQTLSIQNTSSRRRSVRFLAPKTDQFSMELSTVATEVAPGLTLKLKIYFKAPLAPSQTSSQNDEQYALVLREFATRSWHDVLTVMSDSGEGSPMDRTDVQLNAWTSRSAIVFDSFVDFGSVAPSASAAGGNKGSAGQSSFGGNPASVSQVLTLRNDGNCAGRFRIEFDRGVPVTVTPATGTLAPLGQKGNEIQCKVELNTSEVPLGSYRALGRVWLEDQSTTPMMLDLHANVLEASLQLIWPTLSSPTKKGSPLSASSTLSDLSGRQLERVAEVYFGSLFFGETRKIDAVLFNNSPGPINFLVALTDARDEKGGNAALAIEAARQEGAAAAGRTSRGGGAPLRPLLSASAPSDARSIPGSVLGDHDLEAASSSDETPAYLRPDMLVSPMEGRLEAYGSQRLTFVFQPRQPLALKKEMAKGFKNNVAPGALTGGGGLDEGEGAQTALVGPDGSAVLHEKPEPPFVKYAALAKIDSLDGRFRTVVPVLGNANIPAVALSTDDIQFGSCPVHDHRDAFVTLKNVSSELSLGFEFAPLAHFTVRPAFGRLAPRQSQRVVVSFVPNNLGRFSRRKLELRLLGDPTGKQPTSLVPKTNQSKASIKAAEVARAQAEAVVTVPLLLSGVSETIGLNRTIELTTGGPARQAADFAPVLSLVKSAEQVAEEKEISLMEAAEVDVAEDELDGELTLVTPAAAAATAAARKTLQQAGSKQPFRRVTGWNNPALASQYQGRYEVSKGSLDNRVTFTPAELHARTTNQKYYQQFLAGASKQRADGKAGRFEPEAVEPADPTFGPEVDRPRDARGMGLAFASGLHEPEVPLPQQATQLKLKYPQAGFEGEGRKRTVVSKHTTAAANAKPLKTQPTTQAEKRDCEAALSPEEIQSILRGPGMLEFGRLCIGARAVREYRITNDLETHIQVSLKIRAMELVESYPQSAMIPPGVSATFHIVFQSSQEQEFSRQVVYTINGRHDFSFGTSALVVPMDLNLSRNEVAFEFKPENATFAVVESLTLENPYSVPTEYFWTMPSTSDSFSASPSKGVVAPHSKVQVSLKFEPRWATPSAGVTADLVCNITGGAAKKVSVRASLAESSCAFARGVKTVDFGSMCVGAPVTKSVVLRNDGGSRTVFKVEDVPTGVRVKPMGAKLEAGTSTTIQISVYPTPSTQMKGTAITVAVRGRPKDSKPLRLALRGEAFMPSLNIAEPAFDFGGVTLGSSLARTISVANTGAVPASLYIDLSRALDFSLSYAEALGQEEIREDGSVRNAVIQRVSSATIKRNGSTASIDDATSSPTSLAAAAAAQKGGAAFLDAQDENATGGYSIFLAPRSSLELQLVFTPTRVIDHDFELPLSVAGIPNFVSLRRVVTAHGLKPKISLSCATLDFGKRVLLKRGRATKNPYISKFSLRNEDAAPIRWHFKSESSVAGGEPATPGSGFASPVPSSRGAGIMSRAGAFSPGGSDEAGSSGSDIHWRMEPTHGTLQPGQEAVVLVYFSPTAAINYTNTVDIYLDSPTGNSSNGPISPLPQQQTPSSPMVPSRAGTVTSLDMASSAQAKPYTSLLLTGCGTTPRLLFSVDQVVLPTVPLGVPSRFTFFVHNEGYENLELRWETGMDAVRAPITINLPQGSTLGSAHPSLPVEVVFLASKPVSFCLNLNFFDMESNRFSIPVIATADNSLLTIQEYVSKNQGKWDIVLERPLPEATGQGQQGQEVKGGYQKVLNLVELSVDSIAARARAAAVAQSKKQIYAHLQSAAAIDGSASSAFDFAGADDETAASQNGDDINTPGSGPRGLRDADSRLTPVKMLAAQSAASSGDSLFTHTLESVLTYLHSSNLLTGPVVDGEEDIPVDSPPNGQSNEAGGEDAAPHHASKASTGVLSAAGGAGHKRRGSSSPTRHVSFALSVDTFPAELIKSSGSLVRGLVRTLCGKPVPTTASKKKNAFGSRGKNETTISLQSTLGATSAVMGSTLAATQNREYLPPNAAALSSTAKSDALILTIFQDYEELLIFLKSQGALLGGVKPWHLLGLNQLQRLLASSGSVAIDAELGASATMSPAELTARTRRLEKDFPALSRMAWLTVLVQIIKVFIVSRVTPSAFRALPGMSPELACMGWKFEGSNVYSVGESILLEWVSFHYNRSAPLAPRSVVDFQKLTDGIVLCGVISSHVPNVTAIQHLRTNIISIDDCLYNMTKLCAGLKELGLSWYGSAASLVASNARDMILFVLWLFQHLPHFIPKSTLEFKTSLGAPESTQCIELTNPSSSKSIAYSVSMEGSSDFKVDRGVIRLAPRGKPGSTVKVPVRFQSRFSKPVEARLVFTAASPEEAGSGKGAAHASTLVFVLKSHIVDRLPSSSYNTESRMYETANIDVRVTNPFAVDCTFNVTCKIEQEPSAQQKGREASPTRGSAASADAMENGKGSARGSGAGVSRMLSARSSASGRSGTVAQERQPPAVFCPFERVKLRAGETHSMGVQFLPLRMGSYRAQLVFLDDLAGEFMIELNCVATPPAPLELFKWSTTVRGGSETKPLQLSFKNPGLDSARAQHFERIRNLSRQQRDLKKNKPDWNYQILRSDILPAGGSVAYHAHSTSPFFSIASHIVLNDIKLEKDSLAKGGRTGGPAAAGAGAGSVGSSRKGTAAGGPGIITDLTSASFGGAQAAAASAAASAKTSATAAYLSGRAAGPDNKFSLVFTPRGVGVYRGAIVLHSPLDSRVYSLEVTVLAEDSHPLLEFKSPARQSVTQEIPLSVPSGSTEIQTYKASLMAGKMFTGPAELTVYPGTPASYPLTFTPTWVSEVTGTLTLTNPRTDDRFVYDLRGVGEEPLAEKHLVLEASARSKATHKVAVNNPTNTDLYFTVECDLPTFAGPSTFKVSAGATTDYSFTLCPAASGTLLGSLTFLQANKHFQWYGLEVRVAPPEPEEQVSISCVARGAKQCRIEIPNTSDQSQTCEVHLEGVGLFGPKSIELAPRSKTAYEFLYSPLQPVAQAEGVLSVSDVNGGAEMWWRLLLSAPAPEPQPVDFGEVEVGSSSSLEIELENPTDESLALRSSVSGPAARNFAVQPTKIVLAPLSRNVVTLKYTPSTLDGAAQTATVVLSHPSIADFVFHASGLGAAPSVMPVTSLSTPLDSKVSSTVPFRNPFSRLIKVDIEITGDVGATPFQLLLKRTTALVLPAYTTLQIPFTFAPKSIRAHRAEIIVRLASESTPSDAAAGSQGLAWRFPLEGEAEGQTSEQPLVLQCKARERLQETKELHLGGLTQFQSQGQGGEVERFSVEIEAATDAGQIALSKSLDVALLPADPSSSVGSSNALIQRVRLDFFPAVPFRCGGFLVLSRSGGGRWKFPLAVEVGPPDADDTIRLESAVHGTASVGFWIRNYKDTPTPFKAALSFDSAPQFSVTPASGVMPPMGEVDADGNSGTRFVVSFSPVEYGSTLSGSLHISAGDMFYRYDLVGTHVRWSAPVVSSTLDNHNAEYAAERAQKLAAASRKNFLQHNMTKGLAATEVLAHKVSSVRAWKGIGNTSSAAIAAASSQGFGSGGSRK